LEMKLLVESLIGALLVGGPVFYWLLFLMQP
jgi:hypothetical protein